MFQPDRIGLALPHGHGCSSARNEFRLAGEVVDYWYDRWQGELKPDEMELAKSVQAIQIQIQAVETASSVSTTPAITGWPTGLHNSSRRRLQPALTTLNREIYRRAR